MGMWRNPHAGKEVRFELSDDTQRFRPFGAPRTQRYPVKYPASSLDCVGLKWAIRSYKTRFDTNTHSLLVHHPGENLRDARNIHPVPDELFTSAKVIADCLSVHAATICPEECIFAQVESIAEEFGLLFLHL